MGVSAKPLHIDIPVTLREVKTVFSIGGLVFEGDLPASIFHLQLIGNDIGDWNAKSELIAVFHTNAGHATLHGDAYNTEHGTTGADHAPPSPSLSKASPRAESRATAWSIRARTRCPALSWRTSWLFRLASMKPSITSTSVAILP